MRLARPVLLFLPLAFASLGCGGEDAPATANGGAGNAGIAGAAGSTAGGVGGSAGTGAGGAAGSGTGGKAGESAGKAGTGGSNSPGGSSGAAGSSGTGGSASCTKDADCPLPPAAVPAGCAVAVCRGGACKVKSVDNDGDGHPTNKCKLDGVVEVGDDCDDTNADVFPGSWDGPATNGKPNRCGDGVDQNCSGSDGDSLGAAGESCTCVPGDVEPCATDGGGKLIVFPGGAPLGECKLGKRTCFTDAASGGGSWGPCVGAVGPTAEICNGKRDDDCDGEADMADVDTPPSNVVTFSFDGDGDGFVDKAKPDAARLRWCADATPSVCPTTMPGCDLTRWTLATLPAGDCDDASLEASPGGVELCDGIDNDCNGTVDDPYALDARAWVWDWDDDDFGDLDVKPLRSCQRPTTVPAYCASLEANVPATYAVGVAQEGAPPSAVIPACDAATMWKTGFPNTDCKDNPSQGGNRGNKPHLVRPGATDLCNGLDYSCDGSPSTGCPCSLDDAPVACGSADTCNEGTQTCVSQGGSAVLGVCSGGNEKSKLIYCPDDDADGYCDLTACTVAICPGTAPAGHTYKPRTACVGEALPNAKGHDCNDDPGQQGASQNPGVGNEICDGSGKDYNCNGTVNTPGFGDCACNTGDKVKCAAAGLDYPSSPPSDTYPLAAPPPLAGVCTWGEKTCLAGAWTSCGGGVGAQAVEICDGSGKDYNCNGIVNTDVSPPGGVPDCGCLNDAVSSCGVCGTGVRKCTSGQWGDCVGDATKVHYCIDADGDGVCAGCSFVCPNALPVNGRPRAECLLNGATIDCADGDATRGQNKPELCTAIDEDCDGAGYNGYDKGAVCDFGNGVGACKQGGEKICTVSPPTGTTCSASAGVGATTCRSSAFVRPNGGGTTWDWDCSGTNDACLGATNLTVVGANGQTGANVLRTDYPYQYFPTMQTDPNRADDLCRINDGTGACPTVWVMNENDCTKGHTVGPTGRTCNDPCGATIYRIACAKEIGNPSLKRCFGNATVNQLPIPDVTTTTLGCH